MMKIPKSAMAVILSDVATNLLTGASLKLFSNDITVSSATTLDMFVESAYTGYSDVDSLTANQVYVDDDNGGVSVGINSRQFNATGGSGSTPESVYGFYLVSSGGALLAAANISEPKVMGTDLDSVVVAPFINLPGSVN